MLLPPRKHIRHVSLHHRAAKKRIWESRTQFGIATAQGLPAHQSTTCPGMRSKRSVAPRGAAVLAAGALLTLYLLSPQWRGSGSGDEVQDAWSTRDGLRLQCGSGASAACQVAVVPPLPRTASAWRFVATDSTVHHMFGAAATCNDTLWFVNGFQDDEPCGLTSLFHPVSQLWTFGPRPRVLYPSKYLLGNHGAAVFVAPYLYIIGGGSGYVTKLNGVHRLHIDDYRADAYVAWTVCREMPTPRMGHVCAAIAGKVYCAHGRIAFDSPAKNSHDPRSFTNALEVRSAPVGFLVWFVFARSSLSAV